MREKAFALTTKLTALVPLALTLYWMPLKQFLKIPIPSYTTRSGCGRVRTLYAQNNYKYSSITAFVSLLESNPVYEYVRG
jgi:hypothetical protein